MDDPGASSSGSFPDYVVYILIIAVVFLVLMVSLLVCLVFYRTRRKKEGNRGSRRNRVDQETQRDQQENLRDQEKPRDQENQRDRENQRDQENQENQMTRATYHKTVEVKNHDHEWVPEPGPLALRYPPLEAENLYAEYTKREANGDKLFQEEFDSIPRRYSQFSSTSMDAPDNSKKNRYPKEWVSVYDYCRVRLRPESDEVDTNDYINANYVKHANGKKKYIVTQAPMKTTQEDFWRMVWENNVSIIVMLCDLSRDGIELSYLYWPDENSPSRSHMYTQFRVTARNSRQYADHIIRAFSIENTLAADQEPRAVIHFQYTAWRQLPDHKNAKVPKVQFQILKFVEKINHWETRVGKENKPLIVHCSGGTAESGMYMALDQLREELNNKNKFDLYNCVSHLRQQRPNAIHFMSQYKYVFHTLLEQFMYGNTEVDISDLRNQVFRDTTIREQLDKQFQALNKLPIQKKRSSIGLKQENYAKNSYPDLIIPFDDNLVPVSARPGQPNSSYINASWVDGYWEKQAYIVTQDPQRHTAPEFWRMVWEHQVTAVVMLTEPGPEPTQCYHYWPHDDEREVCYDNIVIRHDLTQQRDRPGYSLRTFKVFNKNYPELERRAIRQFHYHEWPDNSVPTHATSLLDMIAQLRDSVSTSNPVTIHCSGGGDRSSVFCAINLAMDQLKDDGKVDIFQTTRLLRHQRPYMIPSIIEYEFLWKAVLQYIETYQWLNQEQGTTCHHV